MAYNYVYDPRALLEYEEAILWYHAKSKQVSENFELAIREKLQVICLHPTRYRSRRKYFRETIVKKYPFSIIYFYYLLYRRKTTSCSNHLYFSQ